MWFAMDALINVTNLKAQNNTNVSLLWLLFPFGFTETELRIMKCCVLSHGTRGDHAFLLSLVS